jgi:hypothetical protein
VYLCDNCSRIFLRHVMGHLNRHECRDYLLLAKDNLRPEDLP